MNWCTQMFCATKREAEFMFDWSSWMIANGEKRHVTFPNKTSAICGSHLVPWCMQRVDSGKSLCIKTECKLLSDAAWHGSIFITTVMWTCELRWTKRLPVLAKNKASYFIYFIHLFNRCRTLWQLGLFHSLQPGLWAISSNNLVFRYATKYHSSAPLLSLRLKSY